MKINTQISDAIYTRYLELLSQGKYKKGVIQEILQQEFELASTTLWDHSVGKFKKQISKDNNDIKIEVKEKIAEKVDKSTEPPAILNMPDIGYPNIQSDKKTFIITGWEIRVGVDERFIDCLNQLAKYHDAEKLLVPIWHDDINYIPSKLKDNFTILSTNKRFNNNLIFHYVPTHALVVSPLTGWAGAFPGDTAIIPGLVKELVTEPSVHLCKQLITTGSVGYLNASYDQYGELITTNFASSLKKRWHSVTNRAMGRTTAIAQKFIQPTALIVDILDDETFFTRFVTMSENGVVYDLDKKFVAGNDKPYDNKPEALIIGDYHVEHMLQSSHEATVEMIKALKPKNIVLNDFIDMASMSYHDVGSAAKFDSAPSIDEEAGRTREVLKELSEISDHIIYLHSNHDNFINKLLDMSENAWRMTKDYSTCCELQAYRLKTGKHPIRKLLELDQIENLTFVDEKDFLVLAENTLLHGHNSYRSLGFRGFVKLYNKVIIGHFHSPAIHRNGVCVGTNAKKDLSYAIGASASMAANAVLHEDGNAQLLPIIYGKWTK